MTYYANVSQKGLNIYGVHKFECKKDEDNYLIRYIKKGFQDLNAIKLQRYLIYTGFARRK